MPNRRNLLCFVLLFLSQFAYPNSKPFPGYYIDSKGDTVRCNIEFNDRNRNPETIKVQVNGSMKEFGPEDIRGFGVEIQQFLLPRNLRFLPLLPAARPRLKNASVFQK